MQDCFRKHPEVYGDELADDEEGAPPSEEGAEGEAAPAPARTASKDSETATTSPAAPVEQALEDVAPKKTYDATAANTQPPSEEELKKPAPEEKQAQEKKKETRTAV